MLCQLIDGLLQLSLTVLEVEMNHKVVPLPLSQIQLNEERLRQVAELFILVEERRFSEQTRLRLNDLEHGAEVELH